MTAREKIIDLLYDETNLRLDGLYPHYEALKKCLLLKKNDGGEPVSEINDLDLWFNGVIKSIFYKPNTQRLILVGHSAIGKTQFFRKLLPVELMDMYTDFPFNMKDFKTVMYQKLIWTEDDFSFTENSKKILSDVGYICRRNPYSSNYEVDKRLVSYSAANNSVPKNIKSPKHNLVIELEGIDKELYNSIDKLELWRDIFFKFRH